MLNESSYEGEWDNEWEPVKSQVNGVVASIPPEPLLNYVGYKGSTLLSASQAAREKPRKSRIPSVNISPTYRPSLQKLPPGSVQSGHAIEPPNQPKERKHIQQQAVNLEAFKRFKANPDKPDSVYQLAYCFKDLAKSLPKRPPLSDIEVAKDSLAEICVSNDAFIKVPQLDESTLEIWGTPGQVEKARTELGLWETYYKGPGKPKAAAARFPRVNAYCGRAVERSARKQLQQHEQEAYQYYADDSMLPFEAHLVWPEGYDLESFIQSYDSDVLDFLRRRYRCRIVHEQADLRETVVTANSQTNMLQVHHRLLGLMKEMVTKKKRGLRVTQCRLPDAQNFRDQIALKPIRLREFTLQIPELCGQPLPPAEIEQWTELNSRAERQYRKATKIALRSCIESLYVSQKHVRMRVSFGTIALRKYKQPTNRSDTYIIDDDFIAMTTEPQLVVEQCPLVVGGGFDLVNRVQSMQEFKEPQICWTVHFDFEGEQGGRLRLEREFAENYVDPDEPSVAATRWLTFSPNTTMDVENLLELSHMVLGEVGYQVHIAALRIFNNQKIRQELRDFERKIKFKPSQEGQRFLPEKHASFVKHPGLIGVTEITIAKYKFKDTRGTFEIRRKDYFDRSGGFGATPTWTEWHAVYYYAEWDSLMGNMANIESGENVEWHRDLSTFFPKVTDDDYPKLLPSGYKKFMKEVEEIRTLLTRAAEGIPGSTVPERKGKGKALNGEHHGVE